MPKPNISISSPPPNVATELDNGHLSIEATVDMPIDSVQLQLDNEAPVKAKPSDKPNGFHAKVPYPNENKNHKLTITANPTVGDPVQLVARTAPAIGPGGCPRCVRIQVA